MSVRTLTEDAVKGKTVFLRLDLNVPIEGGQITDATRITKSLKTLNFLRQHAAHVIVASHLGRPKGAYEKKYSLEPVGAFLAEHLHTNVVFCADYASEPIDQLVKQTPSSDLILLENLRFHPGETADDKEFAENLMKGVDVYVNDAFGTCHRAHASVHGAAQCVVPERRFAGFLVEEEVKALSKLQVAPQFPFAVVVGGAKVEDKIDLMLNLIERCNDLLIGGAMAYTFLHARGTQVGKSLVQRDKLDLVETIYANAAKRRVKIWLPEDHICAESFSKEAAPIAVEQATIPPHLMGLDIGPKTLSVFRSVIRAASTVLWNGPMGVFEWDAFAKGTLEIAKEIANNRGYTVVGGGDSVSALNLAQAADRISHVSTGGGASLEFLEGKSLPGIKILEG